MPEIFINIIPKGIIIVIVSQRGVPHVCRFSDLALDPGD
jgi:hypothetical protein